MPSRTQSWPNRLAGDYTKTIPIVRDSLKESPSAEFEEDWNAQLLSAFDLITDAILNIGLAEFQWRQAERYDLFSPDSVSVLYQRSESLNETAIEQLSEAHELLEELRIPESERSIDDEVDNYVNELGDVLVDIDLKRPDLEELYEYIDAIISELEAYDNQLQYLLSELADEADELRDMRAGDGGTEKNIEPVFLAIIAITVLTNVIGIGIKKRQNSRSSHGTRQRAQNSGDAIEAVGKLI